MRGGGGGFGRPRFHIGGMLKRRIAIAGAALAALTITLTPAYLTSEVREYAPSRTYTENPPAPPAFPSPWIVDEHPYRGLSEPRKDRP